MNLSGIPNILTVEAIEAVTLTVFIVWASVNFLRERRKKRKAQSAILIVSRR